MLFAGAASWAIQSDVASGARLNCDAPDADNSPSELQVLTLLNAERAKSGAQALQLSPGLNRAAAWKSRDSSASGAGFSHTDSLGRSVSERAVDCEYARSMGENIAYGFPSATTVFTAWMGSAGHKSNMLNGIWQFAGIGEYQGRWTLDLGTVNDTSGPPPTATPTHPVATTSTPTSSPPTVTATNTAVFLPTFTPTSISPSSTAVPTSVPATPTARPTTTLAVAAGVQQALNAGFNLVTFAGPEQMPESALRSLGSSLVAAYEWDTASERWLRYIARAPGYVNTLPTMRPGAAYFVVLSLAATWTY
jgi:hypothetical protein